MKNVFVIPAFLIAILLAVGVIFEPFTSYPHETRGSITSTPTQDETGENLKRAHSGGMAVPVTGTDFKVAPEFDPTGAIVSDPTGTILSVIRRN